MGRPPISLELFILQEFAADPLPQESPESATPCDETKVPTQFEVARENHSALDT